MPKKQLIEAELRTTDLISSPRCRRWITRWVRDMSFQELLASVLQAASSVRTPRASEGVGRKEQCLPSERLFAKKALQRSLQRSAAACAPREPRESNAPAPRESIEHTTPTRA